MNFLLKSAIKNLIKASGHEIRKIKNSGFPPEVKTDLFATMASGMQRLKQKGIEPAMIIDLGAAAGNWTMSAMEYWPDARYELVEPLEEHKLKLESLKRQNNFLNYHLAVAGSSVKEVNLNVSDQLDGSGIYGHKGLNDRIVSVITIDEITLNSKGPFLIKFDTHGYEVPILKGATETLKFTEALIIEVYGFHISETSLLFYEMSAYLDTLGFRMVDIIDIMRRPDDEVFWQADAFYLKKTHPIFLNKYYQA